MNWRPAGLADLEVLQRRSEDNFLSANNYGAVNTLLYGRRLRAEICVHEGWLFERYESGGRACLAFPHRVGGDPSRTGEMLGLLASEAAASGIRPVFHNVTAAERDSLLSRFPGTEVVREDSLGDYVYLTESFAALPGAAYAKKRNHVRQFMRSFGDVSFVPLRAENADLAARIEDDWLAESVAADADSARELGDERGLVMEALGNFPRFSEACGMTGGILMAGGRAAAFCVASRLSRDVTDVHFEKCLGEFARLGGYAVVASEFARTVGTRFLNREEDLGIPGLRKAKLSWRPSEVMEKFTAAVRLP